MDPVKLLFRIQKESNARAHDDRRMNSAEKGAFLFLLFVVTVRFAYSDLACADGFGLHESFRAILAIQAAFFSVLALFLPALFRTGIPESAILDPHRLALLPLSVRVLRRFRAFRFAASTPVVFILLLGLLQAFPFGARFGWPGVVGLIFLLAFVLGASFLLTVLVQLREMTGRVRKIASRVLGLFLALAAFFNPDYIAGQDGLRIGFFGSFTVRIAPDVLLDFPSSISPSLILLLAGAAVLVWFAAFWFAGRRVAAEARRRIVLPSMGLSFGKGLLAFESKRLAAGIKLPLALIVATMGIVYLLRPDAAPNGAIFIPAAAIVLVFHRSFVLPFEREGASVLRYLLLPVSGLSVLAVKALLPGIAAFALTLPLIAVGALLGAAPGPLSEALYVLSALPGILALLALAGFLLNGEKPLRIEQSDASGESAMSTVEAEAESDEDSSVDVAGTRGEEHGLGPFFVAALVLAPFYLLVRDVVPTRPLVACALGLAVSTLALFACHRLLPRFAADWTARLRG